MGQKLTITQGIPACGKSTWSREQALKDPVGTVIISKDGVRTMMGQYWVDEREPLVKQLSRDMVYTALENGYSVIVDDTNLHPSHVPYWRAVSESFNVEFVVQRFDVALSLAIQRDIDRGSKVGKEVLTKFWEELYNNPDNPYYNGPGKL